MHLKKERNVFDMFESPLRSSLTNEEMMLLPKLAFEGQVLLIDNIKDAYEATLLLKQHSCLGFDTETRPTFKRGQAHRVALLQLATNEQCFIFRLQKTGITDDLLHILSNKNIVKVGVAVRDDIKGLQKHRRFEQAGFVELQTYVRHFGITDASLSKLSSIVLNARVSKSNQLSNWESDHLTPAQIQYAATDAWASLLIYNKLQQIHTTTNI